MAEQIVAKNEEVALPTKCTGLLVQYFYFFMSLLVAAVVVYGFGQTVDRQLFHPSHPKPVLLSIHAGIFCAWIVFYIVQAALVRTGNVRIHRAAGWFGVALGTVIPNLALSQPSVCGASTCGIQTWPTRHPCCAPPC